MTCSDITLSIENPYILYGNNKAGDFVSRFLYSEDDIVLSTDSQLLTIEKDSTDTWCLYLRDCSVLFPSTCKCNAYTFPITITLDGETVVCDYSVYVTSVSNVENAVSMVGTYPMITLDVTNIPIVDAYSRTPCTRGYDSTTAETKFHILFVTKTDDVQAWHSSFETRFCQIFYNSIKISNMYSASKLFSDGDQIVIKIKTGVDEYGNDTFEVHETTTYPDGTQGHIQIRRVQNDNTLTLEMAVDFSVQLCDNDFIVELKEKNVCNEIPADSLTIDDSGTVSFILDPELLPTDEDGTESCGVYSLYLSSGTCDDALTGVECKIIRYKYDGSNVDGTYTSGTQCIYATPITLNTDTPALGTTSESTDGTSGSTVYVKIKDKKKCCSITYNHVRVKYNDNLAYRYGKQTLNNVVCREGDIVWLNGQYSESYNTSGTKIDGNGLWLVHENAYWDFYDEVTDETFIDLGASVTDTVTLYYDQQVNRKYGNYWLNGTYLSSGSIVNLQNQEDANGLYRVTCGDWEYLGEAGIYSGTSIDATDDIITYNDIDFCTCGIYHIWYYYLNGACVLNSASRTVKVVGKCGGSKEGTLVPGNRIRISDYRIYTEVDDELINPELATSDADSCAERTESFDNQYKLDVTDISSNCIGPIITPSCTSDNVCDHMYWLYSGSEDDKYSSSDNSGFSLVFWKYEDAHWVLYGLVGNTASTPHSYVAYKLDTYGYAISDMVNVSDWFIPSESYSFEASYNQNTKTVSFDTSDETSVNIQVGDIISIVDGESIPNTYTSTVTSVVNHVVKALINDAEDLSGKTLTAVYPVYEFVVPDMTISDASWQFSKSLKYNIEIIGEGYKSGKINYNEDGVSRTVSVAGRYSKGKIAFNTSDYSFSVGQTIMTCSSDVNTLSISAKVTSIEYLDSNDAVAYISFDEKVPQKTVSVYDGLTESSYKSPVNMYTVVGNELTEDTIEQNWSINTNTTKIFISKSYGFRYYNTAISVDEFVDIFNSYGKWNCISAPNQYYVLSTDDSEIITTDALDGEEILEVEKNSQN